MAVIHTEMCCGMHNQSLAKITSKGSQKNVTQNNLIVRKILIKFTK